jgi:hypothetical protein
LFGFHREGLFEAQNELARLAIIEDVPRSLCRDEKAFHESAQNTLDPFRGAEVVAVALYLNVAVIAAPLCEMVGDAHSRSFMNAE